jgi:hypothetical protein
MSGHGSKIARKMEEAVAALLTAPNLAKAAETAGIAESTLRRWMQNETFSKRYRQERDRLLETAVTLLRSESVGAGHVLVAIANDVKSGAAVRVSAAKAIISLAIGAQMLELEERLTELEEIAKR